jgi:hypothetical protein
MKGKNTSKIPTLQPRENSRPLKKKKERITKA